MKKSFLTPIVAIFVLSTTSVYGQFVDPPVNGNVVLTDQTNNLVIGPLPPSTTPVTSIYLNNAISATAYNPTIFSIDNNSVNSAGVTTRTSQLNFNSGGTNYFKLYMSTGGSGCGVGGFHIMPTSTGAGIHMQGTGINFCNNPQGTGCGDVYAYGKYAFDGTIGTTGLNIGYQNTLTPPSGFKFTNSGASYFKDQVLIGGTNYTFPTGYSFMVGAGQSYFTDKVAIGTTNKSLLGTYKLYVGGSIVCEELVVKLQSNWADYVFAPTYKLMPLSEVKTYIDENSHLPGVPAACEVEENGIATSEMLTIQMKKIEELTLYLIQMEARIKELEEKNKALQIKVGQ